MTSDLPSVANLPFLKTDRLVLRPMNEGDTDIVVRWRNSSHVSKMNNLSNLQTLTYQSHLDWFRKTRDSRIDYIMLIRDVNIPIGSLSYTKVEVNKYGCCGLSGRYIGEKEYEGHGYAFEAIIRWIKVGFEVFKFDCIIGYTHKHNTANIFYNKKIGFTVETYPSELKLAESHWVFMKLTKQEWENKKKLNE